MPEIFQTLIWIGTVVGAALTITAGVLAFRRIFRRLDVIGEGVLGKPEVTDFSGAVIEPAVPSIQARVSSLEVAVRGADDERDRVRALEAWRDEHTNVTDAMVNRMMDHILGQSESQ